jgi:hypothetical protein
MSRARRLQIARSIETFGFNVPILVASAISSSRSTLRKFRAEAMTHWQAAIAEP